METVESIHGRRSIRNYQPRSVPRDLIKQVLDDASRKRGSALRLCGYRGSGLDCRIRRGSAALCAGAPQTQRSEQLGGSGRLLGILRRSGRRRDLRLRGWPRTGLAGLQPRRPEPDAVGLRARPGHLLGRIADAVAARPGHMCGACRAGPISSARSTDARLCGSCPVGQAKATAKDRVEVAEPQRLVWRDGVRTEEGSRHVGPRAINNVDAQ